MIADKIGDDSMDKAKLLFNKEYEDFYKMVEDNEVFSRYCLETHGIDFSQDGFSDKKQIDDLLLISGLKPGDSVLEVGCGNGKMAEYIASKTGTTVYGFDYSQNAITSAKKRAEENDKLIFDVGAIGEKVYPPNSFDAIISIDSVCYTLDVEGFVEQLYTWLKPNGLLLTYYSEGQMKGISRNADNTDLALALKKVVIPYLAVDYTRQHFEFLKHKREVIEKHKDLFLQNDMEFYYQCAVSTSIGESMSYEDFIKQFSRYLYVARKNIAEQKITDDIEEDEEDMNNSVKIAQNTEVNKVVETTVEENDKNLNPNNTNLRNNRVNIPRNNVPNAFNNRQPRRLFSIRRF